MSQSQVPIAVIGIGCRFPGGANNPEKLWEMLSEGRDAWTDVPSSRYNWDAFRHPDHEAQGAHNHRGGHFIDHDVSAFDARFFGVPPAEANAMDPQQRLLLEVAYEAFENAGIPIENIQGSNTGVYVATFTHDYESMISKDDARVPKHSLTGIGQAVLSNRISYVFDLKGPSVTVDTACSGSLVALHQACQSLRCGESDVMLAGGTNLILTPDVMIPMSVLHFMNSDGKSYAFDSRGSGYGRGEGVGMVVLKRLDDALHANDTIRAVIRGSGVGQDGKTSGITLPNGEAQQSLIRSVYKAAGLDPLRTTYVEAHGTGTVAGDFTEVKAIASTFSAKDREAPLFIGSIKANLGHLESSSGIAGLIKAVLALERGLIPPQPDLRDLKDGLVAQDWKIQIPRKLTPWPEGELRRVSVNSFGYGGTNAHAVMDTLEVALQELKYESRSPRPMDGKSGSKQLDNPQVEGIDSNGNGITCIKGHENGNSNGHMEACNTNGHSNGQRNFHSTGNVNGHTEFHGNACVNTYLNSHAGGHADGRANGETNGYTNPSNVNFSEYASGYPNGYVNSHESGNSEGITQESNEKEDHFKDSLPCLADVTAAELKKLLVEQRPREASIVEHPDQRLQKQDPQLLTLTAKSETSLIHMLEELRQWVSGQNEFESCVRSLAYTLTERRSILPFRHSIVAASQQNLISSLECKPTLKRTSGIGKVVFIFTGQGSQWYAMGRELIKTSSVFNRSLVNSESILQSLGASWNLLDELDRDKSTSRVNQSEIGQPATTAIQIGLIELYKSLSICPDVVIGHSSGEIAAAYAADALTHESAIKISYHRSFLAKRCKDLLSADGAMMAVGLGEKEIFPYLRQLKSGIASVACVNSPASTTISGDVTAIIELEATLNKSSVFARRLKVDTAYHSHHMSSVAYSYLKDLVGLPLQRPKSAKFFSSVTGEEKVSEFEAFYWVENLVSKVRFSDALESACRYIAEDQMLSTAKTHVFLEVGPHNALAGPARQTISSLDTSGTFQYTYLSSLVRDHEAMFTVLGSAGKLFEKGYPVDVRAANSMDGFDQQVSVLTNLAPYPWDHSVSYWAESRLSKDYRLRAHPYHDLLGLRVVGSSTYEPSWRHVMSIERLPWLQEHVVDGFATYPAAGYVAMAIEAKRQITLERLVHGPIAKYFLKDVVLPKALIIPASPESIELYISFRSKTSTKGMASWDEFRVSSVSSDGLWHEHCKGSIKSEHTLPPDDFTPTREREEKLSALAFETRFLDTKARNSQILHGEEIYNDLESRGNLYGTNFANIKELYLGDLNAAGVVVVPEVAKTMPAEFMQPHLIHPGTLDALIHSCLPVFFQHSSASSVFTLGIGEMSVSASLGSTPGEELRFTTSIALQGTSSANINIEVSQSPIGIESEPVIKMYNGELRGVSKMYQEYNESSIDSGMTYQLQWVEDPDLCTPSNGQTVSEVTPKSLSPEEKLVLLNKASSIFIGDCLENVAINQVEEQHRDYYKWMEHYYNSEESQKLRKGLSRFDIDECLEQTRLAGVEGEAVCRVGPNLQRILSDALDPISLMYDDGFVHRVYADDSSSRCYSHMLHFVEHLVLKNPEMMVLEIGAGTGGATLPLLEGLSRDGKLPLQRYDFTDVSTEFFEHARPIFKEWEKYVQFQRLDIGADPKAQGFVSGTYDLIIASNAIHVTSSINGALSNAQKLLKPNGWLVLVETTTATPFVNMLYGMLPAWYIGIAEGRTESPLLSIDHWDSALLHSSFSGIDYSANDYDGPAQRMSFIASKKNLESPQNPVATPITIICQPDCSVEHTAWSERLHQKFRAQGMEVSLAQLPLDSVVENNIYMFLDDKSSPALASSTPTLFKGITGILTTAESLLWISVMHTPMFFPSSESGLIMGLARGARVENEKITLVTLEMQSCTLQESPDFEQKVMQIINISFLSPPPHRSKELEFVYDKGQVLVPRLVPDKKFDALIQRTKRAPQCEAGLFHQPNRPLKLHVETPGLLDSLRFVDDEAPLKPVKPHEIEVQAMACGLNFKDVIVALGQAKPTLSMVGECAGIITAVGAEFDHKYKVGDRVCAWAGTPYASRARVHGHDAYPLPDWMSFSVGASIPVVYVTAYYGLIELANLRKGQKVLIHAAAGGVGQAALRIAQHIGAEIFATVGSAPKRHFLMDTFKIPEDHIFSSRSGTFKQGVLRATNGVGVDVVLNSLSGDLLQDSWECVCHFGSFIEIGKTDILAKNSISLEPFDKNITFASVDLAAISAMRPETNTARISYVMSMFETGDYVAVEPISTVKMTEIEKSFRLLQAGKHIGKVVLEADETTLVTQLPAATPPTQLHSHATYIIAGGLGGLGLEIARYIATRGAKHIVLLSRRILPSDQKEALEAEFLTLGSKVHVISCDIADPAQCIKLATVGLNNLPPVKGIIHGAMTLQDRLIEQMELDDFETALRPKVQGTRNLSEAFNDPSIDFFVMLSSAVSILGTKGSANYSAGNAFQDAFATSRASPSPHHISISLGAMSESGVLSQNSSLEQLVNAQGVIPLKNADMFTLLEYAINGQAREDHCHQVIVGFNRSSLTKANREDALGNPMFSHLPQVEDGEANGLLSETAKETTIASAQSLSEAQSIIAQSLTQKISTLVVTDLNQVELDRPLSDFGLDSLVVIEIKNWVGRTFRATLQASEIMDAESINSLAKTVAAKSLLVSKLLEKSEQLDTASGENQPTEDAHIDEGNKQSNSSCLQKQPVPNINDTLDTFLPTASSLCSIEEMEKARISVSEFSKSDGLGQLLQHRLMYSDLHIQREYLRDCGQLLPFFGGHPGGEAQHDPATLATMFSLTAFECKELIESGNLAPTHYFGQVMNSDYNQWLFNACREPQIGEDFVRKYKGNDYLVALRHGRPFKIMLKEDGRTVSHSKLKATFEAIYATPHGGESMIGLLTADRRDEWAQLREHLKTVDPMNETSLQNVEGAAFIVCLDNACPSTPNERADQFERENSVNRWYDKSLQIVICDNGTSATICDHTYLDGISTAPIRESFAKIIRGQNLGAPTHGTPSEAEPIDLPVVRLEELLFHTDSRIDSQIRHIQQAQLERRSKHSHAGFKVKALVIQLACHRFFGFNPTTIETVSMAQFRHGRVAVNHISSPEVAEFCKAAADRAIASPDRRSLYYKAAKSLTISLNTASRGESLNCHLSALEWMLAESEPRPALFDEPALTKTKSVRVVVNSLENDLLECGGPLQVPGTFFIHFQVFDDRVQFSVWGNEADAGEFRREIEVAANDIRSILGQTDDCHS